MPGLTFGEVGPIRGLLFPSSCLGATRESLPLNFWHVDYHSVLPASETSQRAEMASNKGCRSLRSQGRLPHQSPPKAGAPKAPRAATKPAEVRRSQSSSEGTEGCPQGMSLLMTRTWGVACTLWRPKRRLRAVPCILLDGLLL